MYACFSQPPTNEAKLPRVTPPFTESLHPKTRHRGDLSLCSGGIHTAAWQKPAVRVQNKLGVMQALALFPDPRKSKRQLDAVSKGSALDTT